MTVVEKYSGREVKQKWGTLRINVSGTAEDQGRDNGKKMTAVDSAD